LDISSNGDREGAGVPWSISGQRFQQFAETPDQDGGLLFAGMRLFSGAHKKPGDKLPKVSAQRVNVSQPAAKEPVTESTRDQEYS
jgi:hypothetical protein